MYLIIQQNLANKVVIKYSNLFCGELIALDSEKFQVTNI